MNLAKQASADPCRHKAENTLKKFSFSSVVEPLPVNIKIFHAAFGDGHEALNSPGDLVEGGEPEDREFLVDESC